MSKNTHIQKEDENCCAYIIFVRSFLKYEIAIFNGKYFKNNRIFSFSILTFSFNLILIDRHRNCTIKSPHLRRVEMTRSKTNKCRIRIRKPRIFLRRELKNNRVSHLVFIHSPFAPPPKPYNGTPPLKRANLNKKPSFVYLREQISF